jgi:hypothetical protein
MRFGREASRFPLEEDERAGAEPSGDRRSWEKGTLDRKHWRYGRREGSEQKP